MFVMGFALSIATLLAISYASFYTGVLCARNRDLRWLFVRVMALLGVVAVGGASVAMLRAESPPEAPTQATVEAATLDADQPTEAAHPPVVPETVDIQTTQTPVEVSPATGIPSEIPAILDCGKARAALAESPTVEDDADQTSLVGLSSHLPTVRPSWVDQPLNNKGGGIPWISVSSGPWLSDFEAQRALEKNIYQAVAEYIDDQIGRRGVARRIRLRKNEIYIQGLIEQRFEEERRFSVGDMKLRYAKVVFTPAFRANIAQRWRDHLVAARLIKTGVGVAAVMVMLFIAFGVLKRFAAAVRG